LADLDENIIRRSLPFGVDTSIGAVETHANENLILRDFEICDYSDRLLGRVFINAQMSGLVKGSDAGRLKDGAARSAAGIRTLHNSGLPSVEQAFV